MPRLSWAVGGWRHKAFPQFHVPETKPHGSAVTEAIRQISQTARVPPAVGVPRVSGPLLDRIDLHVEVPPVKFREIAGERTVETSAEIRSRVMAARRRQQQRFTRKPKITCNARMGPKEIKEFCALDETTKELLKNAMMDYNLSARAYDRILKVARTIADLAVADNISSDHISEAIQLRSLDRQLWG